ncbi:MAG: hypothetical protein J6S60_04530, partial [Oscillospiraceae bacterium]|nr:hypothetical protein [Oscillospiraceae bacterium]
YVRGHNRGLERGTDTFYKAVAEVYNRIIEETQPNYTTMQRPQILRSDSDYARALNMFKTQPFQNFNILYDAFGNLDAKRRAWVNDGSAENRKAYNEAKTNAAKAVSSQIISALVFASMQMLWDHVLGRSKKYKNDEDEYSIESIAKGLGFNAATSLGGMIPFGTEVLELGEALFDAVLKSYGKDPFFDQKWYGFDDAVTETLTNTGKSAMSAVVQSITMIQKAMNGDVTDADWESYGRQMLNAAVDLAKFAGIPADNVRKLATSAARTYFVKTEGKYVGGYDALRLTSDPSKYANDYYDLLYDAYRNDNAAYKEIYGEMIDSGRFDADKIKTAMENRMKKTQGVTKASELDARYMNPTEQAKYDAGLNRLRGSSVWRGATETQRDSALDILYGLAVGANDATTKSAREKIAGGKSVGLDETEYILYTIARAMADQPNKNGKLGTYTNAEVEEAIRSISGLSDAERRYLWIAQGQNEKTSPW